MCTRTPLQTRKLHKVHDHMTPEELAQDKAICEAATQGPWTADLDMFSVDDGIVALVSDVGTHLLFTGSTDILTIVPQKRGLDMDDRPYTADDEAFKNAAWVQAKDSQALKDAIMMAAARTRWPAALAEVERLSADNSGVWALLRLQNRQKDAATHILLSLIKGLSGVNGAHLVPSSKEVFDLIQQAFMAMNATGDAS